MRHLLTALYAWGTMLGIQVSAFKELMNEPQVASKHEVSVMQMGLLLQE